MNKNKQTNTKFFDRSLAATLLLLVSGLASADVVTKVTTYEYDPTKGWVTAVVQHPDDPVFNLRTSYTYDAKGNRLTTVVSSTAAGNVAVATRTVQTVTYGTNAVSPIAYTNAAGQRADAQYDPGNLPLYLSNLSGLRANWKYDSYGRVIEEKLPDGNTTSWVYAECSATVPCAPAHAAYVVKKRFFHSTAPTVDNRPPINTYYDQLGRVLRTETIGFDGMSTIYVDTEFDAFGRVYRTSRPYYANKTPQWTTYEYDVLDRVVAVAAPDGGVVRTSYNGQSTTVTNALTQKQTATVDSRGLPVQITDDVGSALQYRYDAAGRLLQTIDPHGNTVTVTYDRAGNKAATADPDLGSISYVHDALGQLRQQTDAKGQVKSFQYDLMGRMINRAEPDLISTWTYDRCSMGAGKLCSSSADNGYLSTITYDSLGRPSSVVTTFDGTYTSSTSYDVNGRVAKQVYPTGVEVGYSYTALGYPKEIRDPVTNALYWQANSMDAEGHLLQQTYGNSVVTRQDYDPATGRLLAIRAGGSDAVQNLAFTYDRNGNPLTRSDGNQSLSETFLYDSLNRLTSNTVNSSGAGLVTQTYAYDAIGNITSRSDAGTYTYGPVNAKPHAVARISRAGGGVRLFTYDASGNLVAEEERDAANNLIAAKARTVIWSSFNMPLRVANAATSVEYTYGSEHQRVKAKHSGSTTFYLHPDNVGGLSYEKDVKADGTVEHRHFVTAPGVGVVALVKQDNVGNRTISYLHRDFLGSTTAVTDAGGNVIERMAYEPFGKRRAPAGTLDPANALSTTSTNRGFTNHEHLDGLDLIHMNGRVYDPNIGRFITADPNVPDPSDIQSYNRFSYVRNNPLAFVDPSGYEDVPNFNGCAGSGVWCTYKKFNEEMERVVIQAQRLPKCDDEACFARQAATIAAGMRSPVIRSARSPAEREVLKMGEIAMNGIPAKRVYMIIKTAFGYIVVLSKVSEDTNKEEGKKDGKEGESKSDGERKANPTKGESEIWQDLDNAGNGRKQSGNGSRRRYYEWDHTHNDIEVYDKNGRHQGSMDPTTGEMYKPPVDGRRIK